MLTHYLPSLSFMFSKQTPFSFCVRPRPGISRSQTEGLQSEWTYPAKPSLSTL